MELDRQHALARIKRNIEQSGFHIYVVGGGSHTGRYLYTIGLRESLGAELALAGALYYSDADDLLKIMHEVHKQMAKSVKGKPELMFQSTFTVRRLGTFILRKAHRSWVREMLLGALDYYQVADVDAYQIVPDEAHRTIDVPNMARAWSAANEPFWQWIEDAPWPYAVPRDADVMTNLAALRGAPITEVARWEDDYWEMMAGEGDRVREEDGRLVPLAALLAHDPSLVPAAHLAVGEAIWRDPGGAWNRWERSQS